ncbi:MAG: lysophospholipid acyltransferase family protein [Pirellulales bacterium]
MLSDQATTQLSIAVLVVLGLAGLATFWRYYRQFDYGLARLPFYLIAVIWTRVVWRAQINRPLPDPGTGAIIVCNHHSGNDPAFVQLGLKRLPHWMVASEYSKAKFLTQAFKLLRAIPVSRAGIDTAATKAAIRFAQEGHLVGLFPEGRINTTDAVLLPGRPGAAMIALHARVPVIPCYIHDSPYDGTAYGFFFMTGKTRVVVGDLIDISEYYGRENEKEVLEELTKKFLIEMARLAGVEDYRPQLAGRFYKPGRNGEPPADDSRRARDLTESRPVATT